MQAKTSDIGLLIRDMLEGREFELCDLDRDEPEVVGKDRVTFVDVTDVHNPVVHTESGRMFTIQILSLG
jgi:hypothetical protein